MHALDRLDTGRHCVNILFTWFLRVGPSSLKSKLVFESVIRRQIGFIVRGIDALFCPSAWVSIVSDRRLINYSVSIQQRRRLSGPQNGRESPGRRKRQNSQSEIRTLSSLFSLPGWNPFQKQTHEERCHASFCILYPRELIFFFNWEGNILVPCYKSTPF